MVQTVPVTPGSIEFRKGLKTEWRGLRGDDLANASLVQDAVFVHPNGFIGSAESLDGAIKLAKLSMQ